MKCRTCEIVKDVSEFYVKNKKPNIDCKTCVKLRVKKYKDNNIEKLNIKNKEYRDLNKDLIREKRRKYYQENKKILIKKSRDYYENNKNDLKIKSKIYRDKNIEKLIERNRKFQNDNKDKLNIKNKSRIRSNEYKEREKARRQTNEYREHRRKYTKKYYYKNPHLFAWRSILSNTLKRFNKKKEDETIKLLGYSALQLKEHLENLFLEGMNWNNYGEWHIDHIKMVCDFDKNTSMNIVNSLNNLRPLWAKDNCSRKFN